jgi:sugar/nucleoside kinase (ribokinase family)
MQTDGRPICQFWPNVQGGIEQNDSAVYQASAFNWIEREDCASTGSKGETVLRQEAVKVGDVLDTTGAGDCFTGAYAAALLQGRDQQEALRYASTAAGFCVCHKGAMPSLPWSKDLEQLI